MLSREFQKLASAEVQAFLFEQTENDIPSLLFSHKEMFGLPFRIIVEQWMARKKISAKLPQFYKTRGLLYPPQINLEQCSSEATARFKVEILRKEFAGKKDLFGADITGGFGIDSYFFCETVSHLNYVETNNKLSEIVKHNFNVLGRHNVTFHSSSAEDFSERSSKKFDFIFVDPSRRNSISKKVFRLDDCQPEIKNLLPTLFESADFVLLKASPLLDIRQGLNELIHVKKVIVISVDNECKELLFLLRKDSLKNPSIETYNLDKLGHIKHFFSFSIDEEKKCSSDYGEPHGYLYEPNASILKSGAFKLVGNKFDLVKLHVNTHLYSSTSLRKDFPGRIFKIEQQNVDVKNIAEKKFNVITRNYPMKADELKRRLKLSDGGEKYVIGFSGLKKKHVVLATRLA